jgi:hypothetical protein
MFIRISVISIDEQSHQPQGAFHAGWNLLKSGELSDAEADDLRQLLEWFDAHMPVPSKSQSKALSHRAIFWFKPSAHRYIQKVWELAQLLRLHGILVEVLMTQTPGSVVYYDFCQVAAVPNKSTF